MSDGATPAFTVLLPVNRPPALLPFAVESVLAQTRGDFELVILCDGAPAETVAAARTFAARDARVRVKVHEKGEHRGERWRHLALTEARGHFVCQLGDDDLWLPNHLDEMGAMLETVDFGHTLHVQMQADGSLRPNVGSMAIARTRQQLRTMAVNRTGPSCAGYRLAAYRALPEGWAPPPPGVWSDLNMWRKFLRQPGLRFDTRYAVTAICLHNAARLDWPLERRVAESAALAGSIRDPAWCADYSARALSIAAQTLSYWLRAAHDEIAAQQLPAVAPPARSDEAASQALRQQLERLARRVRHLENRLAFVERSRLWRLRQRLARLLGRP